MLPRSSDRSDSARSRCRPQVRDEASTVHGPAGAPPYRLAPFDLVTHLRAVLGVMTTASGLPDVAVGPSARVVRRHAGRSGLVVQGAFGAQRRLVGFCYGFPVDPAQWWERQVHPRLVAAGTEQWLDDAFTLTELHVDPAHQRRGLGRRLITRVLAETRLPRALLTVLDRPSSARWLYRDLGFTDLTTPFRFGPDQPAYTVMGANLPLAARRRPPRLPAQRAGDRHRDVGRDRG